MELQLIPAPRAGPIRVRGTPMDRGASGTLRYLVVTPNLWNVAENSDGEVIMSYDPEPGNLYVEINFRRLSLVKEVGIGGYAEVLYGSKPWGTRSPQAQELRFPVRASEGSRLRLVTGYRVEEASEGSVFNVSYDLWLTREPEPRGGPDPDDVEVMIWLHRRLQKPAGSLRGTANFEVVSGGAARIQPAEVWTSSPEEGSSWYIVSLVVDQGPSAELELSLGQALSIAEEYLARVYGAPRGHIMDRYLNGIEFGSEYGGRSPRVALTYTKLAIRS